MAIYKQLEEAKKSFTARVSEKGQTNVFRHIEEQKASSGFGLKAGDIAPHFSLPNALGKSVTLHDELRKGPVILIFYRGAWCPYCNIQLRAFQNLLQDFHDRGCQLIAVSPQSPDHTLSQAEKEGLAYHVLSDSNGRAAESYNLLFELPDYLQMTFTQEFRLDLTEFNQSERWVLPVPATYIIDQEGIVRYASVDPDFMRRAEPQDVLKELDRLSFA
ncbi:AhpC/TSA family protein [Paenibacillus nanensis]|uniref:thioredoxin-dependent peroxiredoxin n=1 Tax=Paenibacillus nanensis TaxID=393251 RepID=A0A3A1US97_9BACL|nr:peroxiredoxin-like family protein [Paenibacillus nanensis]RIX50281.1 AhpC/TSA family protein [Paenibacillus nanensis]